MALDLEMFEGEDKALPVTLVYDELHSVEALRGQPIQRSHLAAPGLFLAATMSYDKPDAEAFLNLSDDDSTEIEWVNEATGEVLIHFPGSTTIGHRGAGIYFTTLVKLLDGKNIVPESGTGHIKLLDNKVGRK